MSSFSFPFKDHPEDTWSESEAEDVEIFFNWIQELPQQESFTKNHAHLFLHSFYFDTELAKKAFKKYIDIRSSYPHIFGNRDPLLPEIQRSMDILHMVKLPHTTEEGYVIVVYKLFDGDASKCQQDHVIKTIIMFGDTVLSRSPLAEGAIFVVDLKTLGFGHVTLRYLSELKMIFKYVQEAYPFRLKKVYMVNCSSFFQKVMMFLKPLLNAKVFTLIEFLPGGLEGHLPTELLPQDLGGSLPSIEELFKNERKCLETEYRDWLIASSTTHETIPSNTRSDNSFLDLEFF